MERTSMADTDLAHRTRLNELEPWRDPAEGDVA
jgi:hypothetical protein